MVELKIRDCHSIKSLEVVPYEHVGLGFAVTEQTYLWPKILRCIVGLQLWGDVDSDDL